MTLISQKITADSSFYICFLYDINEQNWLRRIIERFDFYIPPIVEREIHLNQHESIRDNKKIIRVGNSINIGEILRPFLSIKTIEKGEHEIIGLGFFFYSIGVPFYLIIDDGEARDFVKNNLKDLIAFLHGTIGFIALCCCQFGVFSKVETIEIFNKIEASKFRISKNILSKIKTTVEEC